MTGTNQNFARYEALCQNLRIELIDLLHQKGTGHPGGSLSCCEILTVLYFLKANISPQNLKDPARDKIVLSKGHAAPMLYLLLAEKGFLPKEELKTLRQIDSRLQGHPCAEKLPGVEISSGPLGLAYSAALGLTLGDRLQGNNGSYVYAILGDGELNEGIIWETAMSASKFQADHLITIVEYNHVQLDGTTQQIMPMPELSQKWRAFGYHVICCDGHQLEQLCEAIDGAKQHRGQPTVILADTVKGKGVSFMEGQNIWHGKPIGEEEYQKAIAELRGDKDGTSNS